MSRHPEDEEMDCEHADALLEIFVDGELDLLSRRRLERHVGGCSACAAELDLARRVSSGLRALPAQKFPDQQAEAALGRITERAGEWPPVRGRFASTGWKGWWRPALALAAILMIALAWPLFKDRSPLPNAEVRPQVAEIVPSEQAPEEVDPAATEVAQAEAEVKLALAYLGRITASTRHTVGHEVLGKKVIVPLSRSVRGVLLPASDRVRGDENAS